MKPELVRHGIQNGNCTFLPFAFAKSSSSWFLFFLTVPTKDSLCFLRGSVGLKSVNQLSVVMFLCVPNNDVTWFDGDLEKILRWPTIYF